MITGPIDDIWLTDKVQINFLTKPVRIEFASHCSAEDKADLADLISSSVWIEVMREFGIPERQIRRFRYGLRRF